LHPLLNLAHTEAAKELKGRVRFCKLDTDKDETMAARLNIMGLPTLLFLDNYEPVRFRSLYLHLANMQ
jgi:thioredoxin-like negative regulator of GroEL